MPGLGRDVLRWLVALNLSFPIKNIKRDFSNGFMVAEIFSRYFPTDIHMHSYDYGSRAASKRDNWEQLNKIFRKKGFVVQNHEMENIIHCRTEEGAGSLLERMYSFLTQQRCKRGEGEAQQPFLQQHDSCKQWNTCTQDPVEACIGHEKEDGQCRPFFCSASNTSSSNHGDYEDETCDYGNKDAMSLEDMYHIDRKLDPMYEQCHDSPLKIEDNQYALDFSASPKNAKTFVLREEERRLNIGDQVHTTIAKIKGFNAIDKARQREVKKAASLAKEGVRGEELRHADVARKARVEAGLAFRSPNRKRNFKEYTLPDYRRQKQFGYVELGSLGPGDPTPELVVKRDKLVQRKEFGRHARSCNIMSHTNPTLVDYGKTMKVDPASSRKKALAFASKIPKPKPKICSEEAQENLLPLQNPHAMSDLQILEAKHQSDKQHIESIRRDLEHFLR